MDASADPFPEAAKAKKVKLDRKGTVEDAFLVTIAACLEHFEANVPAVLKAHDPEGLHQMRVAIRRLRSAVSVFRPALQSETIEELTGEAKELAATLGAVRDLDVFRDEVLDPVLEHYGRKDGLRILAEMIEGRRVVAWANALAAVREPKVMDLDARLRQVLEAHAWRDGERKGYKLPARKYAHEVLAHRLKTVKELVNRMDELKLEDRHKLRIRIKKLRYAAEFFSSLYPQKKVKPYLKELSRLQDVFGYLNDVATAERLLAEVTGGSFHPKPLLRAEGLVLGWHGYAADDAWPKVKKRWKKLKKTKPFWA
jgi:CHAD domain-containing protein